MPLCCRCTPIGHRGTGALFASVCVALVAAGCGGGTHGPPSPQPKPDFALSVSPATAFAEVGYVTTPVAVSVVAENGFGGAVSVTVQGVPAGVTALPSASFSLSSGQTRLLAFSLPAAAATGTSTLTVLANGNTRSHSAPVTLTALAPPSVRTYQDGSVLYLESTAGPDTARIGLDMHWGGSVVEVSVNGTNFVNAHDTGREVQPAFREGKDLNWNPTLGGDVYDQGTPTINYEVNPDSLVTRAQSLQWSPDFYGGGAGRPVAGDVLVEQAVTAVPGQLHAFRVHYKATHLGSDWHDDGIQELPAVYTNQDYSRFLHYAGTVPWTYDALTATQFPDLPASSPTFYVPERWGALADARNAGLTVHAPSNYPYASVFAAPDPGPGGPTDNATNYFILWSFLTISPGFVFEGDVYLIGGDVETARQIVYELHRRASAPDVFAPTGATDSPAPGATLSGVVGVGGWAFDDGSVSRVEVLVDDAVDGTARYGLARPDIPEAYPHAPVNSGFTYPLDTTRHANGPHTLNVRVTDGSGNVALLPDVNVTVSNRELAAFAAGLFGPGVPAGRCTARWRSHLRGGTRGSVPERPRAALYSLGFFEGLSGGRARDG